MGLLALMRGYFVAGVSAESQKLLLSLAAGATLKSHRDIEGRKSYKLHPLRGAATSVRYRVVQKLRHKRLLETNQKFPAATFLLTEKGSLIAGRLSRRQVTPLTAHHFLPKHDN